MKAICITLGDRSENHAGMMIYGDAAEHGFSCDEMRRMASEFKDLGGVSEMMNLHDWIGEDDEACVLVLRNGSKVFGGDSDKIFQELLGLDWDSKYYDTRRSKVLNKHARYNLCFGDKSCPPDYENKQGRVVGYDEVKNMDVWKKNVEKFLGDVPLQAEGNYYYNTKKCGIGFHGDAERKKVVGLNLGDSREIHWIWYQDSKRISERIVVQLNHGDMYVMSEKASGYDWRKKKIKTLRHAAGCEKYLK